MRDGLPIIVCRFVRPRRSEDRRSGIGAQRIVPSTRGKFRKDNPTTAPRLRSSSGDVTLRFSASLEDLRNRDAVQVPLDRAATERVNVGRRTEHNLRGLYAARSRQVGQFSSSGMKSSRGNSRSGSLAPRQWDDVRSANKREVAIQRPAQESERVTDLDSWQPPVHRKSLNCGWSATGKRRSQPTIHRPSG